MELLRYQQTEQANKKNGNLLLLLASLLIMMWVFTAGSKLMELPKFKANMLQQPLPLFLKQALVYALLPLELLNVPLLYFAKTRPYGFALSFLMMLAFTAYIAWMLMFHEHLPCACGGPIPQWGWNGHLLFNIFFTLLAFAGLWLSAKAKRSITA